MSFKKSSAKPGRNTNPANNKPFWYDAATGRFFDKKIDVPLNNPNVQYWDSILEFSCYQELLKVVSSHNIERQKILTILPAKSPFLKWTWNVDFMVNGCIPIECKGQWLLTEEEHCKNFVHTLQVLQEVNLSQFNNLILVGKTNWLIPRSALQVISISSLVHTLKTKLEKNNGC